MAVDEDVDPVVLSLPVYVCNDFLGSTTQLTLLQQPLRPPWRPYEYDKVKQMRIKPVSRKMELDMPLEPGSKNYNDCIEDFKKAGGAALRTCISDA